MLCQHEFNDEVKSTNSYADTVQGNTTVLNDLLLAEAEAATKSKPKKWHHHITAPSRGRGLAMWKKTQTPRNTSGQISRQISASGSYINDQPPVPPIDFARGASNASETTNGVSRMSSLSRMSTGSSMSSAGSGDEPRVAYDRSRTRSSHTTGRSSRGERTYVSSASSGGSAASESSCSDSSASTSLSEAGKNR